MNILITAKKEKKENRAIRRELKIQRKKREVFLYVSRILESRIKLR